MHQVEALVVMMISYCRISDEIYGKSNEIGGMGNTLESHNEPCVDVPVVVAAFEGVRENPVTAHASITAMQFLHN